MSEPGDAGAAVPDQLLVPLLDAAADVLRALDPANVPGALRALAGFDRRGLTNSAARHQLRRALDLDDEFRTRVVEAFATRPEVVAVLDGWTAADAITRAHDAAARDDLAVLTSALYAVHPDGFEFGLGVACSEERERRDARSLNDDLRAQTAQLAAAEERCRRVEADLTTARADLTRLEGELRDERRGRRDRESAADRQAEDAAKRAREAEAGLDKARRDLELADARAQREAERARDAERRLRELKRESADTPPPSTSGWVTVPGGPDLEDLIRRARDLADQLARALPGASPTPAPPRPPAPPAPGRPAPEAGRRTAVPCPPGLRADQPEGLDAMLRTRGVVLVVDGYNVSMTGWPGTPVDRQRDQLIGALERLHLRLRCDVVVVFDGADVVGVAPRRTRGVRVVFSPEGERADPVIIREVQALPLRVPAVVASSDGWVRDNAVREGATPVAAATLLDVLRR
jgi:predicted RNA-binding protein with PIN domain